MKSKIFYSKYFIRDKNGNVIKICNSKKEYTKELKKRNKKNSNLNLLKNLDSTKKILNRTTQNKVNRYKNEIKEDINYINKKNNFLYKWDKIMTFTHLYNDMHETFSPEKIKFTSYGVECRIYIPFGDNFESLTNIKQTLQNNLQCTVLLKSYNNKNYIDAKFIYIENCNKLKFEPIKCEPYQVFLGVDEGGKPIIIDINIEPHILIAGTTRSGKNGALDHAIANLIYNSSETDAHLYLWQGAKGDLAKYKNCKQVKDFCYTSDKDAILKDLSILNAELFRRKQLFSKMISNFEDPTLKNYNEKHSNEKLAYIYIVVDEILAVATKLSKKDPLAIQIMDFLEKIAEFGGAYGMTYIVSHQKPEKKLFPSFLKNMSNVRICFSFKDSICSSIVLGDGRYEAVGLPPRKAYMISNQYEGYLYTTNLTNNIKKYVKDSFIYIKNHKKNIKNNDKSTMDIDLTNVNIKNGEQINIDIKDLKQNKSNTYIPHNYQKVTPKSKEDILKENISKIEGFVPYKPPK